MKPGASPELQTRPSGIEGPHVPAGKSVLSVAEHALLCLTERIHALLDRSAIPVKRDPLWRRPTEETA